MFRCEQGHHTKPGDDCVMVTTKRRTKTYVNERGNRSEGWEIAEERRFCSEHAVEHLYEELDEKGS